MFFIILIVEGENQEPSPVEDPPVQPRNPPKTKAARGRPRKIPLPPVAVVDKSKQLPPKKAAPAKKAKTPATASTDQPSTSSSSLPTKGKRGRPPKKVGTPAQPRKPQKDKSPVAVVHVLSSDSEPPPPKVTTSKFQQCFYSFNVFICSIF